MKKRKIYICSNCGYESVGHYGKCPECNSWNTLVETIVEEKPDAGEKGRTYAKKTISRLNEVLSTNSDRIVTNINEFNRVMGGGIVKDSVTILTAKPGAGKSTLLLHVANDLALLGYKVLYASGEESESQIKARADRILEHIHRNLWVVSDNNMDNVLNYIEETDPDLIILDSIQTFTLDEFPNSRAGSPTQTMECAYSLVKLAKNPSRPRAVFLVGQMTKEDEIAGVRALEHLVDTVLLIEGESGEELRSLLTTKNRYGSTGEIGFFNMTEKGMISIDNPSAFFITKRDKGDIVSGNSITVVREGTRAIILEVESLVSNSFTPYPSRISECMNREQLNTLISILEQRGGIKLYDKNVVIKTTGGIKLTEQSSNLAVIMSIVSSVFQVGIPNDRVFVADVGLTGELKKVPSLESRLKEVDRMGFAKAYVAKGFIKNLKLNNLEIIEMKSLKDVIDDIFNI
ncbi:DNA repair protein RadA [Paratissierella segnis]|uniref:DNA repair protein RadA n=1 Tax=Paratissierella segnis TaxID=2763679 RepID=A0A926EQT3_9FIRM|nr:DNA repair protein RadA [Paratissierella segnis]MBC8588033.1 DNA repair protein RadA [Paratissierella segnis]